MSSIRGTMPPLPLSRHVINVDVSKMKKRISFWFVIAQLTLASGAATTRIANL